MHHLKRSISCIRLVIQEHHWHVSCWEPGINYCSGSGMKNLHNWVKLSSFFFIVISIMSPILHPPRSIQITFEEPLFHLLYSPFWKGDTCLTLTLVQKHISGSLWYQRLTSSQSNVTSLFSFSFSSSFLHFLQLLSPFRTSPPNLCPSCDINIQCTRTLLSLIVWVTTAQCHQTLHNSK